MNADIRKTCDELAEQGFLAVAPDLFWRQGAGVDLNVTSEADWQHGLRLYGAYDRDAGVKDVKDTVDAARNLPECTGKVAVLGYCLGALMVFLTAVRNDGIDAAIWYHGGDTEKYLGEADGLNAPLLTHLAEEDEVIFKVAQAEIKAALAKNQTRRSTAIRVKIMPLLDITVHTTMLPRQRLPTSGHGSSYINICGDLWLPLLNSELNEQYQVTTRELEQHIDALEQQIDKAKAAKETDAKDNQKKGRSRLQSYAALQEVNAGGVLVTANV